MSTIINIISIIVTIITIGYIVIKMPKAIIPAILLVVMTLVWASNLGYSLFPEHTDWVTSEENGSTITLIQDDGNEYIFTVDEFVK